MCDKTVRETLFLYFDWEMTRQVASTEAQWEELRRVYHPKADEAELGGEVLDCQAIDNIVAGWVKLQEDDDEDVEDDEGEEDEEEDEGEGNDEGNEV